MSEVTNEVVEIYSYVNNKGEKVYTPNFEFANIMARKNGTFDVFIEKN
ncbi:MAG: hypothetical protein RLZ10_1083 [Bacteroidota bacterium]|jgi:hypothetical protein